MVNMGTLILFDTMVNTGTLILFDTMAVFTLNFLPYRPKFKYLQAQHQFSRPEFENSINSNHQNSKHDDVPNIMWTCMSIMH